MKFKSNPYLLVLFLPVIFIFLIRISHAKSNKAENIVLILVDGYRWQELFRGAEHDLLLSKKYNSGDSLERVNKYWDDDLTARRKKLMPFTWNYISEHGQLYGNRDLGNFVNVKNPYWISYPGRAEVLSGSVDSAINSNSYPNNTDMNVLEFLNGQNGYRDKVVTFACWGATGRCLNKENSRMLISVPWENIPGNNLTEAETLANEIQHYAPKTFGEDERLDFEVYALAKSYIKSKHPKVIYIDFGDPDEYAHSGKYKNYLDDIHNLDEMIGKLWKMMQADDFYKEKTAFFIVPDHGRGSGDQWTDHGSSVEHSNETWFMAMGPGIPAKGEMKMKTQIFQDQYAKTIAGLLGFDYTAPKPVGEAIESVKK
ncbi:MAG: hypothetical protein B6D37_09110 [Sphingobacteriales bacterium UTBCD1]|jgi:hypothetical protein|nr:MAG: hypothetical protein B6D37_09110 [Sphingobacteriales bacterium UTBCD1]